METRCRQCNRQLPEGASFCIGCGAVVEGGHSSSDVTGTIHALGTTSTDSGPIPKIGTGSSDRNGAAVLLIVRGPSSGSEIELVGSQMQAGRAPDNAIFLDDITVSRAHAKFVESDRGWTLVDLGSLNGTYVNRERIDTAPLSHGDEIQIGKYRFHYLAG